MAFILYLFENRDVRNGRKEQNTGTELNGVSPATMHYSCRLLPNTKISIGSSEVINSGVVLLFSIAFSFLFWASNNTYSIAKIRKN